MCTFECACMLMNLCINMCTHMNLSIIKILISNIKLPKNADLENMRLNYDNNAKFSKIPHGLMTKFL